MESILIRERYKVIRVLDVQEDYAFAEVVDILDREKRSYLFNIYEGPLLRAYIPCFDQLEECDSFRGMFLEGDSLIAMFDPCGGKVIDRVFYRGAKHSWQTRLAFAELLLHKAMSLSNLPPAVSCAAMLSENVFVDLEGEAIRLRFKVVPLEEMNGRELVFLTVDQLRKIFVPRFDSGQAEMAFLDLLEEGRCVTAVQLYALWREQKERIEADYQKMDKKNFFWRWLGYAWGHVKRAVKRRKQR